MGTDVQPPVAHAAPAAPAAPAERFIAEIHAHRLDDAARHRDVMLRLSEIVDAHQRLLNEVAVIKTWVVIAGVLFVGGIVLGIIGLAALKDSI